MIKKWRPFWSYDIDKTERWLSESAAEGKQLIGLNRFSRMFLFEEAEHEEVEYQVVYDKTISGLPRALGDSGWENLLSVGNWKFVKNSGDTIRTYPSRDGVLKRNRMHSLLLTILAFVYGFQLIPFAFAMLSLLFFPENSVFVPSPLWSITFLYFIQAIAVIVLTFYMTTKLRAFERKYFSTSVDAGISIGKTFAKWKFSWMYAPDLIENWLSDMSEEGNHLVQVGKLGTRFVFEKGAPKLVSYVHDYQLKTSPNYYDIHKSAGWQLKFTSPHSITKYSIWQKEYEAGGEKPQFTYDAAEKKAQVRKVLLTSTSLVVYFLVILAFNLWLNFFTYQAHDQSLFQQIIIGLLIVTSFVPIRIAIRTFLYARRMRNV